MSQQSVQKSKINSLESCLFFIYKSHDMIRQAISYAEHNPHIDANCCESLNEAFNCIQTKCAQLILAKNRAEREYLDLIKRGVK